MWRIFNFLFGWDYIVWENSADQGVARVHKSPDGVVWYWRYRLINVVDKIKTPDQVTWLTCKSSKYLG